MGAGRQGVCIKHARWGAPPPRAAGWQGSKLAIGRRAGAGRVARRRRHPPGNRRPGNRRPARARTRLLPLERGCLRLQRLLHLSHQGRQLGLLLLHLRQLALQRRQLAVLLRQACGQRVGQKERRSGRRRRRGASGARLCWCDASMEAGAMPPDSHRRGNSRSRTSAARCSSSACCCSRLRIAAAGGRAAGGGDEHSQHACMASPW